MSKSPLDPPPGGGARTPSELATLAQLADVDLTGVRLHYRGASQRVEHAVAGAPGGAASFDEIRLTAIGVVFVSAGQPAQFVPMHMVRRGTLR